jgi:hypothetical protein
VSIWASWIMAVRLGIRTSLARWDTTAIRFGMAGLISLPYLAAATGPHYHYERVNVNSYWARAKRRERNSEIWPRHVTFFE